MSTHSDISTQTLKKPTRIGTRLLTRATAMSAGASTISSSRANSSSVSRKPKSTPTSTAPITALFLSLSPNRHTKEKNGTIPPLVYVIKSKIVAENYKQFFIMLWEIVGGRIHKGQVIHRRVLYSV